MANTKSAAKSARQSVRRREINAGVITGLKTEQKKFRAAIAGGADAARAEFVKLTSALDKAAKRGIIHSNVADRRKGRLNKALAKAKA
ncbi:MAG: 30S ribosomal protein S20 [Terrimicrobiaceae bacterium]|jgi:small subunit ribosomal protein S20|nr:30S ribosomal protein S20 [Terrimicrobiaceae bacterium]